MVVVRNMYIFCVIDIINILTVKHIRIVSDFDNRKKNIVNKI